MLRTPLVVGFLLVAGCATTPPQPANATALAPTTADAMAAYDAKQFATCAERFAAIAASAKGRQLEDAEYGAACCLALDGKTDLAFARLDRAVDAGFRDRAHAAEDADLLSLHGDPRWPGVLAKIDAKQQAYEASLGQPALRRELLAMKDEDQKARFAFLAKQDDLSLLERIKELDAKDTARLQEIVDQYGWPGRSLVGDDGAFAAWLLVQHADAALDFQKRCLSLLEPLVATGEVRAENYAYLYDRVAAHEKRPQRYGTQFEDNGEPYPVEDAANLDARRKAVGLSSMAEYRERMRRLVPQK